MAEKCFREKGYDDTSISHIASRAGFSKRTVYIYFENKQELFSAIVLQALEDLERHLQPLWTTGKTGRESLRAAAISYGGFALADPKRFEMIMTFELQHYYHKKPANTDSYSGKCQVVNDRISKLLTRTIERAIQDKSLSTDLTPLQFNLVFWASYTGIINVCTHRALVLEGAYSFSAREMILGFLSHILPRS